MTPTVQRVLGTRDLVLMNIAATVGLRWRSAAARHRTAELRLYMQSTRRKQ